MLSRHPINQPWSTLVRTETYFASAALVTQLERAGAIAHVHHDGGDIIHVELATGQHVLIHLIESSIPSSEILATLEKNTRERTHTLFLFWADRLLPPHGEIHDPEDWMRPLLGLYDGHVYGYEVHGRALTIYPVAFERLGRLHRVRYGRAVEIDRLHCMTARPHTAELNGPVLIAYVGQRSAHHIPASEAEGHGGRVALHPLAHEYTLLGLAPGADSRAIKRAFRRLARIHHPDLNPDPAATLHMQKINDAYRRLLRALRQAAELRGDDADS